jgi:hypothetical protein
MAMASPEQDKRVGPGGSDMRRAASKMMWALKNEPIPADMI